MDTLEERIHDALATKKSEEILSGDLTRAAVLVPLFRKGKGYQILFTKRTETVKHHKGEISFPGGVYDLEDQTLERTALRESFEEIGLEERDVKILGCLDDVETLTRYVIRPFVATFPHPYHFVVNQEEIEEIIEIPLQSLLERDRFEERRISTERGERTIYSYRFRSHLIWGATAKILKEFLDMVSDLA